MGRSASTVMPGANSWSAQQVLIVTVLVSIAAGALAGYGLGYAAQYQGPRIRVYYLFNSSLPFNETVFGIPHDTFSPDRFTINRGDTIAIHYYNIEDTPEKHSFTMDAPYTVNKIVDQGQNVTITFTANLPGVFQYYCIYHTPTMTGYLTVLG